MKRIIKVLSVIILLLMVTPVFADNYKMMELIPQDKKVTIRGDIFLYKDIECKNGKITFGQIKNISDEKKKITVSLAVFDEDRNNITIVNHCVDEELEPNQIKENYEIELDRSKFADNKKVKDIKYYAILSENKSCRMGGEKEYVGRKITEINRLGNNTTPYGVKLLIRIVEVIVVVLILLFLYKFLFTGAYRNMDGEDVRAEYDYINKQKEKERNKKKFINPNVKQEKEPTKSEKVLAQEEKENKKENKDNTDLQNMYK